MPSRDVSEIVVVATGVTEHGRQEIRGMDIVDTEDEVYGTYS